LQEVTDGVADHPLQLLFSWFLAFSNSSYRGRVGGAARASFVRPRDWLNRIAGAGIVFFGLVSLRLLPFKFLNRDMRFHREIRQGKLRSFVLGLACLWWTQATGPLAAR